MLGSISWRLGRSLPPFDCSVPVQPDLHRAIVATLLLAAWSAPAFAQNSNLSDHDRYIHNESERNTKYFNNADSYPKTDASNYARFRAQQQQAVNRFDRSGEGVVVSAGQPRQTAEDYFQDVQRKSLAGDVAAKIELANCYYRAYGVALNKAEAYRLYREAGATNGLAEGIAASMIYFGDGVPTDQVEGLAMFKRAAAQGDQICAAWLAEAFPTPESVEQSAAKKNYQPMLAYAADLQAGRNGRSKDPAKAVTYFQRMSEADIGAAQEFLGCAYAEGNGVAEDLPLAEQWLTKAYAGGTVDAAYHLAKLADRETATHPRDVASLQKWSEKYSAYVTANPSPSNWESMGNLEKTIGHKEKARAWWLKSIEAGGTGPQGALGVYEWYGYGGPVDDAAGRKHIAAAAAQGEPQPCYVLGLAYESGLHGLPVDRPRAAVLFQSAADQGYSAAQSRLAWTYYYGNGVPVAYDKALFWAQKAAEDRKAQALYLLGLIYRSGKGVPVDPVKSLEWMEKAAEQGEGDAQGLMAVAYFSGDGRPQSYEKSAEWAQKAAENGDSKSMYILSLFYEAGGAGVPKDTAKCVGWLQKAAAKGDDQAMYKLAGFYQKGEGLSPDPDKSVEWMRKAAAAGSDVAKEALKKGFAGR